MTMPKKIQAKDISISSVLAVMTMLEAVQSEAARPPECRMRYPRACVSLEPPFAPTGSEWFARHAGLPRKVVEARMRALARRGLLRSCSCGCGGWSLTKRAAEWSEKEEADKRARTAREL